MNEYIKFMNSILAPAARQVLQDAFTRYQHGDNLDVENKSDGSPASIADRTAEHVLRNLIHAQYPDHGVIGEEFGAENVEAEYVWIIDPLDGTREFLNKTDGWCSLIGLFKNNRPLAGVIDDPYHKMRWSSNDKFSAVTNSAAKLTEAKISCTNSEGMFRDSPWWETIGEFLCTSPTLIRCQNGVGFAHVATGKFDLAVENKLKLHDIAALLPVLWQAEKVCYNLDGQDYQSVNFDLSATDKNYSVVTGSKVLVEQVITKVRE